MSSKSFKILLIVLSLILSTISLSPSTSWAARTPSIKGAHNIARGFFNSYGKKYKDSLFGKGKVNKVEINSIQEQAKNLAEVDAFVSLDNAQSVHVLITMKKTPPFGWSVQSWEMADF